MTSPTRQRVVVLQDALPPYRRPFFNALAAHYAVCVVHAGPPARQAQDRFDEKIVPSRRVGPFMLQRLRAPLRQLQPMKAVITIFDLHWPSALHAALCTPGTRRLLWGHRESSSPAINRLRSALMQRVDGVIQYGDEEIERLVARGVPRQRIFVAPNTFVVEQHADLSSHPKSTFLYVGRLQARKRLDELLTAFAAVREQLPAGVRIEIIGDGSIQAELQVLAAQLGVADRTDFTPGTNDPQLLRQAFSRAFAYVSPDCVGLGVLHAFAHGVPVVTSNHRHSDLPGQRHGPEFTNLEPGRNALVADGIDALAGTLATLAAQPMLSRQLGQAAYRHYADKRRIEHMVDGFRRAIEGV